MVALSGDDAGATLVQIAPSRIPGRAANAVQVMKMAQALSTLEPRTVLIAGRAASDAAANAESLKRQFGVQHLPPLRLLPLRGRFGIHLFNLRAALAARGLDAGLVLSRSIGAAAFAARMGLPTVYECHAPPQGFERTYWRWLAGAAGFRRLAVISAALRALIIEDHPEAEAMDIVIAPDGVDLDRFRDVPPSEVAKCAVRRDPDRPIAGYAGHLYTGRGKDLVLTLAERLPDWDFVIAGGHDADVAALRAEVERRRLGNVALWGFVANAELPRRLAICDVLLMPYGSAVGVSSGTMDTAGWMSPLKMFEYMAMGRAIVSADLPVLREVLDDDTARLITPDDADAWTATLASLDTEASRAPLAAAAKAAAVRYDWRQRCEHMLRGLHPAIPR